MYAISDDLEKVEKFIGLFFSYLCMQIYIKKICFTTLSTYHKYDKMLK